MKDSHSLFNEPVSRSHRSKVLREARKEFKTMSAPAPNLWLRQLLKAGLTLAGLGGLTWWSTKLVPQQTDEDLNPNLDQDLNAVALLDADPEMLENLDWLEDLDLIDDLLENSEELEEWSNS